MPVVSEAPGVRGGRSLAGSLDLAASAEDAFALLTAVEKWPVWLSFVQSAGLRDPRGSLRVGAEVVVRSTLLAGEEHLYEVDRLVTGHHLSLVGAYSVRRRMDFRIERKTTRAKVHMRVQYPAYHGRIGLWLDTVMHGRKLAGAVRHSLELFRGLAEFPRGSDAVLVDL